VLVLVMRMVVWALALAHARDAAVIELSVSLVALLSLVRPAAAASLISPAQPHAPRMRVLSVKGRPSAVGAAPVPHALRRQDTDQSADGLPSTTTDGTCGAHSQGNHSEEHPQQPQQQQWRQQQWQQQQH
jgi:hypothetical protein